MEKKCKYCKEKRDIEYEFARPNCATCVYCNDKGIDDSNYKERLLGGINEPKTIKPISNKDRGGIKFYKN